MKDCFISSFLIAEGYLMLNPGEFITCFG